MMLATKSVDNTEGMTNFDKDSSCLRFAYCRLSQPISPHEQLMWRLLLLVGAESLGLSRTPTVF